MAHLPPRASSRTLCRAHAALHSRLHSVADLLSRVRQSVAPASRPLQAECGELAKLAVVHDVTAPVAKLAVVHDVTAPEDVAKLAVVHDVTAPEDVAKLAVVYDVTAVTRGCGEAGCCARRDSCHQRMWASSAPGSPASHPCRPGRSLKICAPNPHPPQLARGGAGTCQLNPQQMVASSFASRRSVPYSSACHSVLYCTPAPQACLLTSARRTATLVR
jgi:hypothetical protein